MELTASDIAERVKGRLLGDGAAVLRGAAGLAEAKPTDVSFLRDDRDAAAVELFRSTKAGAIIAPKGLSRDGAAVIEVDNPTAAFAQVLGILATEAQTLPDGIHPSAVIHPTAKIGTGVRMGPGCVVEKDAVIGDGACLVAQVYVGARTRVGEKTLLYPQVVLRNDVTIGSQCIIHPGTVIGADGYGYFFAGGRHNKIPQVGTVTIEDDVEIGANACIDRATTGATVIGRGTKIDNLVQIAHNVRVGPLCLVVAQVGVAGSCTLGAGVVLAGQVGMADHVSVGDGAQIGGQAGLMKDVPAKAKMTGSPAQPLGDVFRQHLFVQKLPELFKDVKKLKERMEKNV